MPYQKISGSRKIGKTSVEDLLDLDEGFDPDYPNITAPKPFQKAIRQGGNGMSGMGGMGGVGVGNTVRHLPEDFPQSLGPFQQQGHLPNMSQQAQQPQPATNLAPCVVKSEHRCTSCQQQQQQQ